MKPEGVPQLCQTDEIGELCVCSVATGTSYYGLTGMTKNTFEVRRPSARCSECSQLSERVASIKCGLVAMVTAAETSVCWQVYPVSSSGGLISEYAFVRTGLLSFIGPGGLVFITGKMDGLIMVSGRRHNADDIVATALAVEPMKFVYRGR